MDYKATLDYLYAKLPMFTRVGAVAFKTDLHNTIALCNNLGNPQHKFKSIHVGGTNGKGSTSHMLAAIFQKAGYKTGLYTSPHLKDFRERIRINGQMISEEFVVDFVESQQDIIETISPSFFEVTVSMAFSYFAIEQVDIAIIEVGLGGRLDSTNVITPELSIITNISFDHTNLLGNTITEIAGEKAGIIKEGIPVIIGERQNESDRIFLEKAATTGSEIFFANEILTIKDVETKGDFLQATIKEAEDVIFENLQIDLTGSYQLKNILTVIQATRVLTNQGFILAEQDSREALKEVKQLTGLQGRWQILSHSPLTICDTGHNEAGIREVINNIKNVSYKNLRMVIGMVKDKDISAVLAQLPTNATYYFCAPDLERALSVHELQTKAGEFNLSGETFDSVKHALENALHNASQDDLIFIGGSTFVVAEIL